MLQLCEILFKLRNRGTNGFFGSAAGNRLGSDGIVDR